jgi:hypothetical protein
VDPSSLVTFRVLLGAVLLWSVGKQLGGGWIAADYVDPPFHFTWVGLGWVTPLPLAALHVLVAGMAACAVALAVGAVPRLAAALLALGFGYLFLLEQARYLNHIYLLVLLLVLMAAAPLSAGGTPATWTGRRRDRAIPALPLLVLRTQLGLVYLFAGLAKLNGDWLAGAPLGDWLADRATHPVLGDLLAQPWAGTAFAWSGLAIDLAAWPLLSLRATRGSMITLLVAFHLLNASLFNIGMFPWMSMGALVLFVEPDTPRRVWRRLLRRPVGPANPTGRADEDDGAALLPSAPRRAPRLALGLAAAWLTVQALVPLRHHLYPGDVAWNEEGHRFSWRMKLRDKDATAVYLLVDPASGEQRLVDPKQELTLWQVDEMGGRPDMLLQYAHHLSAKEAAAGRPDVEVRVTAEVSLNGRPPKLLVDPRVDLSAQPRDLWHRPWVTDAPD